MYDYAPEKRKVAENLAEYLETCMRNRVISESFSEVIISLTKAEEIFALLKEQEAVEPSFKQDEKGIFVWCCGSCGAYMYHIYDGIDKAKEYAKFCRQCGKPVLWEGR